MATTASTAQRLDPKSTQTFVHDTWRESIVPKLVEYIAIPNKSAAFDPQWKQNGHMDRAVALIEAWCKARKIEGLKVEVVRLKNEKGAERTPVIFMEIPGTVQDTVLLYGHLDKQPEMTGWNEGLGAWKPVIREDKLYGRGGADDGYAAFASLAAIEALRRQKVPHARCVVIIEACEESGSFDLPAYVDHLAPRIGTPSLIVCLDSGCGNYEQLWGTTSLRGLVGGDLSVEVLTEGVHSGDASGIVASSFRILRKLLARVDDTDTGAVIQDFHVEIPADRRAQAKIVAQVLKDEIWSKFPFVPGMQPMSKDPVELVLNRTWRPALSIVGMEGVPALKDAGNVLRPRTVARLSLRVPPTFDAEKGAERLKRVLEADPPYGARVTFTYVDPATGKKNVASGWNAPAMVKWLEDAVDGASRTYFGKPAVYNGEGGSIPFMGMLGAKFPRAQFLITGLLGPGSNAHGPNEFLHIPTGERLTSCVASVIADHGRTVKA
jgi:acetylornithine deacetylase/succinyl-diaminopimelate desuccinylase-like protein